MCLLYRVLIALLPGWFREEFAGEMLWIFDQTTGSKLPLLLDVVASLIRQWLGSALLWQCVLIVGTAPAPYLFGLQMWKGLKPASENQNLSQQALLSAPEIAFMLTVFVICLFSVAACRYAMARSYRHLSLNCRASAMEQ